MNDDEIIAEAREELFRRNQGEVGQGRVWGVIIPALLRRIKELEAALEGAFREPGG